MFTSSCKSGLMLRLFLMIKAQPELMNQKYPMLNGSERSFADLIHDDGQNQQSAEEVDRVIRCFHQIDPSIAAADDEDEIRHLTEIFHKIRINALHHAAETAGSPAAGSVLLIQHSAFTRITSGERSNASLMGQNGTV
jgi:hypothetical protein